MGDGAGRARLVKAQDRGVAGEGAQVAGGGGEGPVERDQRDHQARPHLGGGPRDLRDTARGSVEGLACA